MRRRAPELLVVLVALLLYARVLLGDSWFLDVFTTEVHPHAAALQSALRQGTLPFWVPELMFGYPLAFNPQVGALYPPHLLLLWGLDVEAALALSATLHTALAGLGAMALARRLGQSELGAAVAGVCLAGSPFLAFYHQALHGLATLAWFPWMLLAALRLSDGYRRGAFVGLALATAMALYAGHVQLALLGGLATALTARSFAGLARIGAAGAVGVLLYGPQLLAARALHADSLRRHLGADAILGALDVETYGADDLVELVLPNAWGGPSLHDFWYPEYLGPALGLVILGALAARSPQARLPARLAGAGLLALVLVHVPGVGRALLSLPGLQLFRAPGRFAALLWLGAALLAGAGADAEKPRWRVALGAALAALGVAGALVDLPVRDADVPRDALATARAVDAALLVGGGLALAASARVRWAALVALVPLVWVATRYAPTVHARREPPAVAFLRQTPHHRVLGVGAGFAPYLATVPGGAGWPHGGGHPERAGETLVPDTYALYGLSGLHAQVSLPLERVVRRLYGDAAGALDYPPKQEAPWTAEALTALGVSHLVAPRHGLLPVTPRPRPVFERDGAVVYALPGARGLVQQSGRDVAWRRTPGGLEITLAAAGSVSIQEAWFDGWTAALDGAPLPIAVDDGAFMRVDAPRGGTLTLRFSPTPFVRGAWLALAGGLILLGASLRRDRPVATG